MESEQHACAHQMSKEQETKKKIYVRNRSVHPSLGYTRLSLRVARWLEPILADIGEEAGCALDGSPVNHRAGMYSSTKNTNDPQLILHTAQATVISPFQSRHLDK